LHTALQRCAVVLDLGLIGCLVHYRGCREPLLILTEPRETEGGPTALTTAIEALGATVTVPAGAKLRDTADLVFDPISGRELEVLRLLNSDLSNREIAARLFIYLDTVKTHTKHLYAKLGVHKRHEAVTRARNPDLL
jgi:DNA-binding NarL/FixJ family response regulator